MNTRYLRFVILLIRTFGNLLLLIALMIENHLTGAEPINKSDGEDDESDDEDDESDGEDGESDDESDDESMPDLVDGKSMPDLVDGKSMPDLVDCKSMPDEESNILVRFCNSKLPTSVLKNLYITNNIPLLITFNVDALLYMRTYKDLQGELYNNQPPGRRLIVIGGIGLLVPESLVIYPDHDLGTDIPTQHCDNNIIAMDFTELNPPLNALLVKEFIDFIKDKDRLLWNILVEYQLVDTSQPNQN